VALGCAVVALQRFDACPKYLDAALFFLSPTHAPSLSGSRLPSPAPALGLPLVRPPSRSLSRSRSLTLNRFRLSPGVSGSLCCARLGGAEMSVDCDHGPNGHYPPSRGHKLGSLSALHPTGRPPVRLSLSEARGPGSQVVRSPLAARGHWGPQDPGAPAATSTPRLTSRCPPHHFTPDSLTTPTLLPIDTRLFVVR
jgi:hypothetical protein